jgi:hypothetical protein
LVIEIGFSEEKTMSDTPMPHVIAALFCEKILQEADGSLSVIRIADKLTIQTIQVDSTAIEAIPEELRPKPPVQMSGLVSLRSGPASGKFTMKVVMNSPSGKRKDAFTVPLELHGADHGQNIILNIILAVQEEGLFWFDVLLDDHQLTRIPLMVVRAQPTKFEPIPTTLQ